MAAGHIHNWALDALLARTVATKADVARDAVMTPAQLGDLASGRRAGTSEAVRDRVAAALGVDVRAITCWCDDRPGNHGGGRP